MTELEKLASKYVDEKCDTDVFYDAFIAGYKSVLNIHDVSGSLTPFGQSIKLLRDLADLQNGAPIERQRCKWEETMEQVYDFLNRWENQ